MATSRIRTAARAAAYGVGAAVGLPVSLSVAYATQVYASTPSDQISTSHTPYSIWVQSLTNLLMTQLGRKSSTALDQSCDDGAKVNEDLLLDLLQRHKDTSYGIDHRLGEIASRNDFRVRHPITDHDHYEPYVFRVSAGEHNVMFPGVPRMIGETSGTSGRRKLLPVNPLQRQVFFTEGIGVTFQALIDGVTRRTNGRIRWPNLQKSAKLMFRPKYTVSPGGGLRVGPNSSSPDDNKTLLQLYTTPPEAWAVQSEEEMLFLHGLYALLDRNLGFIESNFASGVFNFFVTIDERWDDLVSTIRTGRLPTNLHIDDSVRETLERTTLVPNPSRADELDSIRARRRQRQRQRSSDGGGTQSATKGSEPSFARLVWPTLHTILAVETGSFRIYGDKLRREWVGDDVSIYSPLYAATEGLIGVNPHIDNKTYILHPKSMFFEFLPAVDDGDEESSGTDEASTSDTLFIEQLQVGKTYEMIITNLTGLYRYRFGDVVRCVGYQGEAPIVEFAYRKGQFLNALGERTSEEAFYSALSKAASDWNLRLNDYTTVEYFNRPVGKRKPRYTVFVELADKENGDVVNGPLTKSQVTALDEHLGEQNELYAFFRKKKRLHCVEVVTVRKGTFESFRRAMVDSGIGPTQLKVPRVTRQRNLVDILEGGA